MLFYKCKMCGGTLEIQNNKTIAECEYCGSKQTIPQIDDEKKLKLYERANKLRLNCEFDKAAGVYENIVADFPEDAECYWGLVLCTYGIEYVDDTTTGKKKPTCHRSSFDSVMDSDNFEMVMENADAISRSVYREEAKVIEEIRKGIIEVSGREEAYDIFICYKETDDNGERTIDSVLAQDVYDALVEKGYRVFFSRITLEDKLGMEYEPYIFAALNSAKVMLAFGTSYDYYNAVWVKNEWSRYLKLMAQDKEKHLIPCFKGIDAYDLPKEFAKLQAQDMSKLGFMQDLIRGIHKIIRASGIKTDKQGASDDNDKICALLKQIQLLLNKKDWSSAKQYCDSILESYPHNAAIYLMKLLADLHICEKENLVQCEESFEENENYQKVLCFAGEELKQELSGYIEIIKIKSKQRRKEKNGDKIWELIEENKETEVLALIEDGIAVDSCGELGQNILCHVMKYCCSYKIIDAFIREGADINRYCRVEECYPLNYAVCHAVDINIVKLLLDSGADIKGERLDVKTSERYSALADAVKNKNYEIIKLLIDYGADVNYICHQEDVDIPILNKAILNDASKEIVELLLNSGANVNSVRTLSKYTASKYYSALCDAVLMKKDYTIAKLLIGYGADVNYMQNGSLVDTPLLNAAILNGASYELVELLLNSGADANSIRYLKKKNESGRYSALCEAVEIVKNYYLVKLLIEHGADVNYIKTSVVGNAPILNLAILTKVEIRIVDLLLESGANANSVRIKNNGNTYSVLIDTILSGDYQYTKLLLQHGANPNSTLTEKGLQKSALALSMMNEHYCKSELIEMLLDAGAEMNYPYIDNDGIERNLSKVKCKKSVLESSTIKKMKEKGWRPPLF